MPIKKDFTTLQQLAARAGCSVSQASRALTGKGRVSESTRQKIMAAAQELNYSNQSPRHQRYYAIVLEEFCDSYRDIMEFLQYAVSPLGKMIVLESTAAHLLKNFFCDAVLTLDLPESEVSQLRQDLFCPTISANYFQCCNNSDISRDWKKFLTESRQKLCQSGCSNILTVLPAVGDNPVGLIATDNCNRELYLSWQELSAAENAPVFNTCDGLIVPFNWTPSSWYKLCSSQTPPIKVIGLWDSSLLPEICLKSCTILNALNSEFASACAENLHRAAERQPIERKKILMAI